MLSSIPIDLSSLISYVLLAVTFWNISSLAFNTFLHPLRTFPGPALWKASFLPRHYYACTGRLEKKLKSLHDQYGEVVRYSPSELSFSCPEAWNDIYGYRKQQPLEKDAAWYNPSKLSDQSASIFSANNVAHTKIRKQLLPAFSERALREQEPMIAEFVGLFVAKLRDHAVAGQSIDLARWYNYLLFDLAGDLALGKSFNCLNNGDYHGWVANIFNSIKTGPFVRAVAQYTDVKSVMRVLAPAKAKAARTAHEAYVKSAARERLARGIDSERKDFTSYILQESANNKTASAIDPDEFAANCGFLILAGSEATATTLSGTTYNLLANPTALARASAEVRSAFSSAEEITFASCSARLPYVHACIAESMRLYPPAPNIFPRTTASRTPITVAGHAVPGATSVGVHMLSSNTSAANFHQPDRYVPERWLSECTDNPRSEFHHDRRDAMQPFSVGPKNCIGKALAWNEMRCVVAKMLWSFDMRLEEDALGWKDRQMTYTFWEKGPLMVKLAAREV